MDFMLSQVAENMTDDILNDDLDFMLKTSKKTDKVIPTCLFMQMP
jgi:hypothetical protein